MDFIYTTNQANPHPLQSQNQIKLQVNTSALDMKVKENTVQTWIHRAPQNKKLGKASAHQAHTPKVFNINDYPRRRFSP